MKKHKHRYNKPRHKQIMPQVYIANWYCKCGKKKP